VTSSHKQTTGGKVLQIIGWVLLFLLLLLLKVQKLDGPSSAEDGDRDKSRTMVESQNHSVVSLNPETL